jgi:hypothetical protein
MSARAIIESHVRLEQLKALEELAEQGSDAVIAYCDDNGLPYVASRDRELIAINGEWMLDTSFGQTEMLSDWLEVHGERKAHEFELSLDDFNARFWEHPELLYHATDIENTEAIQQQGLQRRNKSRGISNRGVGSAVYTTTGDDEAAVGGMGSYGDTVFEINTPAMKRDGYRPAVSQEPAVAEYETRMRLARFLGAEGYQSSHEDDMSPTTVVVHGDIPPQYIRLFQ